MGAYFKVQSAKNGHNVNHFNAFFLYKGEFEIRWSVSSQSNYRKVIYTKKKRVEWKATLDR